MDITVVLVRPREEGNVGAAARAMANMGVERLILVDPVAELGVIARAFAVGAGHVLAGAVRAASLREALAPFPCVIGTTSTRDRRRAVPLLGPRDLPAHLAAEAPDTPVALVFGPEVGGLTNDDLALASAVVTIPCSPVQPTLNLAQSVLILVYEIYQAGLAAAAHPPTGLAVATPGVAPAAGAEVDGLFDHVGALLGRIGFDRDSTFSGVLRDLRAAAARARLGSREVAILRGICRRAEHALGAAPPPTSAPPAEPAGPPPPATPRA